MAEKVDESGTQPPREGVAGADKDKDKETANLDVDPAMDKTHQHVVQGAFAAASKEKQMTLLQGIKLYPKAIFFSVIISTCIVMEGYDVSLINNFCTSRASPQFDSNRLLTH